MLLSTTDQEMKMDISSSIVLLQPGFYILRHPKIAGVALSITRAPNCMATVEVLATPKTHGTILRDGADCIVMLISNAPAELLVTSISDEVLAEAASLKIDRIALDAAAGLAGGVSKLPVAPAPKHIEIGPNGLSIIGHLELKGDVVAKEGDVLGDPNSTLRVEGIQLMWPDRPDGVDLAYNISVEGFGATPVVKTGNFCGSRGQAKRITEVTFTLVGPEAGKYRLDGQACFSGGFIVPVESGMPLGGPSGIEHLTAISLRPIVNATVEQKNPWTDTGKTKVFKAKAASPKVVGKETVSKKAAVRTAKTK